MRWFICAAVFLLIGTYTAHARDVDCLLEAGGETYEGIEAALLL
jgi:hypothetical protein